MILLNMLYQLAFYVTSPLLLSSSFLLFVVKFTTTVYILVIAMSDKSFWFGI